ncbi:hypothetical protein C8R43DRAFT_1090845 [Mycena crocata]|nr:hypothetical protein C8R43DRAFT_1090845 [Mycena crocata]
MHASAFVTLLALAVPNLLSASPIKRADDFINPTLTGGSFLDKSAGLGEPLNVIISGKSSPEVLTPDVLRESFGIPGVGTCLESLTGGNHFRVFPQSGSGALFLAVSKEEDVSESHTIIPDGYNIGRDLLVGKAVGEHTGFEGKKFKFNKYDTTLTELTGLLPPGADGINHGIAQDGVIKMLTVTLK